MDDFRNKIYPFFKKRNVCDDCSMFNGGDGNCYLIEIHHYLQKLADANHNIFVNESLEILKVSTSN